jgi:type IX secretion system PorP/SprF family membrane protein
MKLGIGVQPGYLQYRVKLYDAVLADEGDQVLTGSIYSANAFDVNVGIHLYSKKFFVMASVQHLLGKQIKFTSYNTNLSYHYNAILGYNFEFKKKKFQLQPSVLVKYTKPIPIQWSGMLKGTYDNKYWLGLIYRSDDAFGVSAGIMIKERFTVGYGYDFSVNGLRKYNSGSHEVMLSFILTKKRPTLDEKDDKLNNSILEEALEKEKQKEKTNE